MSGIASRARDVDRRQVAVGRAAQRDPGTTFEKPIEFEIDGVHFVAYRRACFVLRQDAVEMMRQGSWLLVHAREPGQAWQVYAFDRADLNEALSEQMRQPSYAEKGWYGFTKIPARLDQYIVVPLEEPDSVVAAALADAAAAITQSFARYWPADAAGANDAGERNVTIHLAHAFLQRGFGVYAEANHPNPAYIGIDLLAIAPDASWFCAVECKRIINGKVAAMADDVHRVRSFRLNERLKPRRCGDAVVNVARSCKTGIGVVAGLHWVPSGGRGSAVHRLWTTGGTAPSSGAVARLQTALDSVGATYLPPMSASDWPNGKYDLLAAVFAIGPGTEQPTRPGPA